MTTAELTAHAKSLEAEIFQSSGSKRIALQPKLQKVLNQCDAGGVSVPRRLRKLNSELLDEAIEAQFDNMPV